MTDVKTRSEFLKALEEGKFCYISSCNWPNGTENESEGAYLYKRSTDGKVIVLTLDDFICHHDGFVKFELPTLYELDKIPALLDEIEIWPSTEYEIDSDDAKNYLMSALRIDYWLYYPSQSKVSDEFIKLVLDNYRENPYK